MNESTKHLLRQNAAILSPDETAILTYLMPHFQQAVYDPQRNLYILYNRAALLHDAAISTAVAKNIACRILNYQGKTINPSDIGQYDPCRQAVQFEKLMEHITDEYQLQQIFDYLPYTADKKFNLAKRIHVRMLQFTTPAFASTPEKTVNHLELIVWPFSGASGYSALCSDYAKFPPVNNIAVMLYVPPKYVSADKCPANILMDNGTFQTVKRKPAQKTIDLSALVPGTSYLDSKGVEHLYLGKLTQKNYLNQYPQANTVQIGPMPMYLRVTDTIRTQLTAASSMTEFLEKRLTEKAMDAKIGDILVGISQDPNKKLKTRKTVFFRTPDNLVKNLRICRKNPINPAAEQISHISTE